MQLADEQVPSGPEDPGRLPEEEVQVLDVVEDEVAEDEVDAVGGHGPGLGQVVEDEGGLGLGRQVHVGGLEDAVLGRLEHAL